jgi:prepilin-type N-terminal cleavage/methylation domain-containing protein
MRRGFTLIELLTVIVIVLLLSVIALPTVIPAISHRQVGESARLLQAALAGARDAAIRDNALAGIRLLPDPIYKTYLVDPQLGIYDFPRLANGQIDPTIALAANAWVPIGAPPAYDDGLASVCPSTMYSQSLTGNTTALVLEESVGAWTNAGGAWVWLPNSPTSWSWNVRAGDRLRINNTGAWYTVVGPNAAGVTANPQRFVNAVAPGQTSPLSRTIPSPDGKQSVTVNPEFLLLVNGRDDNGNGWVDEGCDGVDNNANGIIDDPGPIDPTGKTPGESEPEAWLGAMAAGAANLPYTITRRPAPTTNSRQTTLPSEVVVDLTTWATTQERSRLTVDPYNGTVDLVVMADGKVVGTTIYSAPSSVGMAGAFHHFWLAERADVVAPVGTTAPSLPTPSGTSWLVTVFARTGAVTNIDNPAEYPNPFAYVQQGGR